MPSGSPSEFTVIIQAAVEDRNGTVLDTPPAPRLADEQATEAYLTKRARDLPAVTRSKAGFKSSGFWYTSFSTKVTVESVNVSGSEAIIQFTELTEEYLASTANGPSNVPSSYSLPQTARFRTSKDGWQLDRIAPSKPGFGLPMSIVVD
ncbi:hypothetical protein F8G81_13890 [Arthrobacter sp. CDRTa11]|uniref:hypothetical protein n=1 Tax=Arthrobacter sp. CDRTa11 TaxID=2651199 RepID=UPI002265811D|nr:hypothetical protein [Arthrobacter sp. CDRTa11]UZX03585.1 hypothetical protein F8G81_13890 [Arthrobacter sp. CDRTa11]